MARSAGVRIVPSILNGGFDRARVAEIIHDPARRAQHIDAILALVMENDFDGIDIDYESLYPEDRDNFSLFIEELAAALHAEDKLLSMAVHAKTEEPGNWGGPQAQDWVRLGAAVDEFKIMVYDYHNGASEAGPIAPLAWADDGADLRRHPTAAAKDLFGRSGLRLPVDRQPGRKPDLATDQQVIEQSAPIPPARRERRSLVRSGHGPDRLLSRRRIHAGAAANPAHRPPRSGRDLDLVPGRGRSGYLADHSTRNALTNLPISKSPNLWEI